MAAAGFVKMRHIGGRLGTESKFIKEEMHQNKNLFENSS